ncbi:MAG: hypothetical protein M3540_13175 [Actinomycetota bacterium]|nr:hypothetical protein [Actinomycetota bacterium]
MKRFLETIFGAHGQLVVGSIATLGALGVWIYYTFFGIPTVAVVFHISMAFGVVASYSISRPPWGTVQPRGSRPPWSRTSKP